jgi:hypothetical protein
LQVYFQRFPDSLYGRLRSDCRTAEDVFKTATSISNMLRHGSAAFFTSLIQRPSDILQRVIVPTRFCMSYQVDFFH